MSLSPTARTAARPLSVVPGALLRVGLGIMQERGKGVGLGLATVFGIVKQNEGLIDVRSTPGEGTTFTISLPRCPDAVPAPPVAQVEEPPDDLRGEETLLLVEDEEMVLHFSEHALLRLGYRVLSASSPGQALDLARRHAAPIHLLVTDVVMPGMNGRELAQLLSAIVPGIRCLFMSGYTADIITRRGVMDDSVHFIQKPFRTRDLAAKIRAILG